MCQGRSSTRSLNPGLNLKRATIFHRYHGNVLLEASRYLVIVIEQDPKVSDLEMLNPVNVTVDRYICCSRAASSHDTSAILTRSLVPCIII